MEHAGLLEKLLQEIAVARAGITANYGRLWRYTPAEGSQPPAVADEDAHESESEQPRSEDA